LRKYKKIGKNELVEREKVEKEIKPLKEPDLTCQQYCPNNPYMAKKNTKKQSIATIFNT
jgi:hypothetical protein